MRLLVLALSGLLALAPRAAAQILPVGDEHEEYLRVLEAHGVVSGRGSSFIRPLGYDRALAELARGDTVSHPWRGTVGRPATATLPGGATFTLADPGLRLFWNGGRPYGPNEGAVWAGVGLTTAFDLGGTLRWGPLSFAFHPVLSYAQNEAYPLGPIFANLPEITDRSDAYEFEYPWRTIDLPQRFGTEPFWEVDPGQSSIRLDMGPVATVFGTENLWWGPGIRNGILMSNEAGGFLHLRIETNRPVGIGVGTLEAQWLWGSLQLSDWFDSTFVDPGRYLTGAVVTVSPKWLPGLHLGGARVFYKLVPEDGISFRDLFLVIEGFEKADLPTPEDPIVEDAADQMAAFLFRWVFPESGFEIWAEFARNDHGLNLRDYFLEPEHGAGRTYGLRKTVAVRGNRILTLEMEATNLQIGATRLARDGPTYYGHHAVLPGYTQRGQGVGAWIGGGGSSQYLAANLFAPWGKGSLFIQRRVMDNDAYYTRGVPITECCHHAFLDFGGGGRWNLGAVEYGASALFSKEYNRYFVDKSDHWNLHLRMEARWRPR